MPLFLDEYEFREDLNYLIYYRGGFAPCTRGHFSLIQQFASHPNVKYFIHQIGERHGIPYKVNRKILKIYLNELFSDEIREKITVKRMGSSLEVLEHLENIDVVIYLKGNGEKDVQEDYSHLKSRFSPLICALKERGIPLHFLIIDRPLINKLSATKFVEAVSNKHHNLKYFMPEGLSHKSISYIISKLRRYL